MPSQSPAPGAAPHDRQDRVPRLAYPVVAAFLAGFLYCGIEIVEAWPLTGWKLFSDDRHPRRVSWEGRSVDRAGNETKLSRPHLPRGVTSITLVVPYFRHDTLTRQDRICRSLVTAARRAGREVVEVRIYRRTVNLWEHKGRRTPPPARDAVVYTCTDGGLVRGAA